MKNIVLCTLLLITSLSFGQRKYFADRYFEDFSYNKAAELYENIYNKGDSSVYILSRLGDSYYNNSKYVEAEKWYEKLLNNHEQTVAPEYLFKYSQSLKSNGKVAASDQWLLKFKNVKEDDSRPQALQNNKGYFVAYTNKSTVYLNVNNIATNTKYSDFGGFIYENKLYFASTKPQLLKKEKIYNWNNQPYLNIYSADQKEIGTSKVLDVTASEKLNELNTRYHESNLIYSKDGNTVYFTRDNYDGKKLVKDKFRVAHLKIYRAEKIDDKWRNFTELPFNSDDYSVGHPALSPDEKTLYFVSDMPNGFGLTDIYKVSVSNHKEYGAPENLGKKINTEGKEMFPYVDKKHTLYFSSNGHLGLGALDVFESKTTNNQFSAPVNLGAPVNSNLDDFSFVINDALSNGYFSSNREGGKGDDDIYSFILFICKENIGGTVRNLKTGAPIENALVKLVDATGVIIAEQTTKIDGAYFFEAVLCEKEFTVVASKQDYRNDLKKVQTLNVDKETVKADLQLDPLIEDVVAVIPAPILPQIAIKPIYFDFDKYTIREDARYELEHIVDVMNNNPSMVIKIESHTDSRAPRSYNRVLSDNRAKATRDYIISRGIARERIESAIGYGEERLLNHCDDANISRCTKEENQINRRSYFYIVKGAENVKVTGQ